MVYIQIDYSELKIYYDGTFYINSFKMLWKVDDFEWKNNLIFILKSKKKICINNLE